jgi:hypothetical protein
MSNEHDADLAARFDVINSITPPDNWPNITNQRTTSAPRRDRQRSWILGAAVAACLAVFAVGLVATVTRSIPDSPPAQFPTVSSNSDDVTPIDAESDGTCQANGTCDTANWDAVSIDGNVIDLVYTVDSTCSGALVGTSIDDVDDVIGIEVLVSVNNDTTCSGQMLQRSTTVLTSEPVASRALTGCRTAPPAIAPTTDPGDDDLVDCRGLDPVPVYDGSQTRDVMSTIPTTAPDGNPYQAPIESEPIDITEPGSYEFLAQVPPEQAKDCAGWVLSGDLEIFASFQILSPEPSNPDYRFDTRTIDDQLYVVVPIEVAEVYYPALGVTLWVC